MKILLEINDSKAEFFMEMLSNLTFVKKATAINDSNEEILINIKQSVMEMNLINKGQLKARDVQELIDEL
jgi:hypothetical protein